MLIDLLYLVKLMKKCLFILRHAAHNGNTLQETLDVILTTAAFDQSVAILFLDAGVFNIKNNQLATQHSIKDTNVIFAALELYDVQDFYVEVESLQHYGVDQLDLSLQVQLLFRANLTAFINQFDIVYSA